MLSLLETTDKHHLCCFSLRVLLSRLLPISRQEMVSSYLKHRHRWLNERFFAHLAYLWSSPSWKFNSATFWNVDCCSSVTLLTLQIHILAWKGWWNLRDFTWHTGKVGLGTQDPKSGLYDRDRYKEKWEMWPGNLYQKSGTHHSELLHWMIICRLNILGKWDTPFFISTLTAKSRLEYVAF